MWPRTFRKFGDLSKTSERGQRRIMTALQSFVSIPIHHCRAGSALQVVGLSNSSIPLIGQIAKMSPSVSPDPRITPVAQGYAITVGRHSLVAFVAINGVALCLCIL